MNIKEMNETLPQVLDFKIDSTSLINDLGSTVLGETKVEEKNAFIYDNGQEDEIPLLEYKNDEKKLRIKGSLLVNQNKMITDTNMIADSDAETIVGTKTINSNILNINNTSTVITTNSLIWETPNVNTNNSLATKSYVDNYAQGLVVHQPVDRKSTENIEGIYSNGDNGVGATFIANKPFILDGYEYGTNPMDMGKRILLTDQLEQTENGIYTITAIDIETCTLTRATDLDGNPNYEIKIGSYVNVTNGTSNAGTGWVLATRQVLLSNPPVISMVNGEQEPLIWKKFKSVPGTQSEIGTYTNEVVTDTNIISNTINHTIISSSNTNIDYILGNGSLGYTKKIQSNKLVDVFVKTDTGTLLITPRNPIVDLIYTDHWEKITGEYIPRNQQVGKLRGGSASSAARQGTSVALSADGNTLAIGGPFDANQRGSVWVFVRNADVWTQQAGPIIGSGVTSVARLGTSVALSADGNTLAIGAVSDGSSVGAAWVFTRNVGIWTQESDKLIGSDRSGGSGQGQTIALSADGNTLAVGGPFDTTSGGAVWIYIRTDGNWTQQGSKLRPSDNEGDSRFGFGLSLSADGNTLAVGGVRDAGSIGAAWVFKRSGVTWSQQNNKLVGTGYVGTGEQGFVSLSADGNTLAVGGVRDNTFVGATWIYKQINNGWVQQGNKLVGSGAIGTARQGNVFLSADGNTLAIGGSYDNIWVGATWIYKQINNEWVQQGSKLIGIGGSGQQLQGVIALSAEASTLAVGGLFDDNQAGSVWIFN